MIGLAIFILGFSSTGCDSNGFGASGASVFTKVSCTSFILIGARMRQVRPDLVKNVEPEILTLGVLTLTDIGALSTAVFSEKVRDLSTSGGLSTTVFSDLVRDLSDLGRLTNLIRDC